MRTRLRFAGFVLAAIQFASVAVAQQAVTESGMISGTTEGGLTVYRGVPFAAPSVGDLRWRAPLPESIAGFPKSSFCCSPIDRLANGL